MDIEIMQQADEQTTAQIVGEAQVRWMWTEGTVKDIAVQVALGLTSQTKFAEADAKIERMMASGVIDQAALDALVIRRSAALEQMKVERNASLMGCD